MGRKYGTNSKQFSKAKQQRQATAEDTMRILTSGCYSTVEGSFVDIQDLMATAIGGSKLYEPDEVPCARGPVRRFGSTRVEVTGERTVAAALRVASVGVSERSTEPVPDGEASQNHLATSGTAVLNFASGRNPGGGFLKGALAQEESLAVASSLYPCIKGNRMYLLNNRCGDKLYTDCMVYSPCVPIFRDADNVLLEVPVPVGIITCPAPNAGEVRKRATEEKSEVAGALKVVLARRIQRVLAAAAEHGDGRLVLGAWGCGVFGNDPDMVSGLFHSVLSTSFAGVFRHVVFAIGEDKVLGNQFDDKKLIYEPSCASPGCTELIMWTTLVAIKTWSILPGASSAGAGRQAVLSLGALHVSLALGASIWELGRAALTTRPFLLVHVKGKSSLTTTLVSKRSAMLNGDDDLNGDDVMMREGDVFTDAP
ncbi:hypothetical protein CYMTET_12841 [Cymbomonas tetramitiformis]|uniref:Microbial-type PARG catalytic domain-containing protein n=1 Tax=Cymbomonas tetramitiformis TaxID=36881 RepID=A0AAE0GJM0_9CHLO|nr:hypothetical protein CYMTET_12841 [Cymbomonas tetramitiformis]